MIEIINKFLLAGDKYFPFPVKLVLFQVVILLLTYLIKYVYNKIKYNRKIENNIENRIIFKIKTGCYVELLMPKTMKLLRSANSKITKDENGENIPCLEITELVLIH